MLTRELKEAAPYMMAKKDESRPIAIHLRLHALPQLLFPAPTRHFPQQSDEPGRAPRPVDRDGHRLADVIKDRVVRAFRGKWAQFVAAEE